MRKVLWAICVLAAVTTAGCRPAATPLPNTAQPASRPVSPLPTPIVPQSIPPVTPVAPSSPTSTPRIASGVRLTALLGPTCPGPQRPGQVCTRPYQGEFSVTNNTGAEVARATTDQNGQATIDLPPGVYMIMPKVEGKFPSSAPTTVTVLAGQYVDVNIQLDSGIR